MLYYFWLARGKQLYVSEARGGLLPYLGFIFNAMKIKEEILIFWKKKEYDILNFFSHAGHGKHDLWLSHS